MCSANLFRGDKQRDFPFVLFGPERSPWVSDDAACLRCRCERTETGSPGGEDYLHFMFGNVARGSRLLLGKTRDDESATSSNSHLKCEKFTLQDPAGWLRTSSGKRVFKRCPKQGRLTRWLSRARSWCRPAEPPPRLRSRRDPRNISSLRTKPAPLGRSSCGQSLSPGLFNDGTKQFSSSSPRPAPEDGPAPAVGSDLAQDQGGGEGRGKPPPPRLLAHPNARLVSQTNGPGLASAVPFELPLLGLPCLPTSTSDATSPTALELRGGPIWRSRTRQQQQKYKVELVLGSLVEENAALFEEADMLGGILQDLEGDIDGAWSKRKLIDTPARSMLERDLRKMMNALKFTMGAAAAAASMSSKEKKVMDYLQATAGSETTSSGSMQQRPYTPRSRPASSCSTSSRPSTGGSTGSFTGFALPDVYRVSASRPPCLPRYPVAHRAMR